VKNKLKIIHTSIPCVQLILNNSHTQNRLNFQWNWPSDSF